MCRPIFIEPRHFTVGALNSNATDSSLKKYLLKKVYENLNKNLENLKIEPTVFPSIKHAAQQISKLTITQFKTEQLRIRQLNTEKSKYKQSVMNKHLEKFKLNDCLNFVEKLKKILVENQGFISVDISVEPCFEEVEIKGKGEQSDVKNEDDDDMHYCFWMEFAGFSSESRADTLSEAKLKGYERLVRKITKKSTIDLVKLFFDVEEREKNSDVMQIENDKEIEESEAVIEEIDF